ncbi:MAG: hypothetical protein ChlgKO_00220 [Chlamydiales bacterium]
MREINMNGWEKANIALNALQIGLVHCQNSIESRVNGFSGSMLALNAITAFSNTHAAIQVMRESRATDEGDKTFKYQKALRVATPFIGVVGAAFGACFINRLFLPTTSLKGGVWINTRYQNLMQTITLMNLGLNAFRACKSEEKTSRNIGTLFTAGHLYSSYSIAAQKMVKAVFKKMSDDKKTLHTFSLFFRAENALNPKAIDADGAKISVNKVLELIDDKIRGMRVNRGLLGPVQRTKTSISITRGVARNGVTPAVTETVKKVTTYLDTISKGFFSEMLSSFSYAYHTEINLV